ncbi:MAG: hypothetical protein JEZ06_23000 [Anaerolineaceae bacterium]|nr:hypothetical protein [Anaerolineaceae bacterium]
MDKKRIVMGLVIFVFIIALVLGVEFFRGQASVREAEIEIKPGEIPVYVDAKIVGAFSPQDLEGLEVVSFVDDEEGKTQEGWLLSDVLIYQFGDGMFNMGSKVIVSSSSNGKSVTLSWSEIIDEKNFVLYDLSGRGTLKLVSKGIEYFNVRDEWIQDVDRVEVSP